MESESGSLPDLTTPQIKKEYSNQEPLDRALESLEKVTEALKDETAKMEKKKKYVKGSFI